MTESLFIVSIWNCVVNVLFLFFCFVKDNALLYEDTERTCFSKFKSIDA